MTSIKRYECDGYAGDVWMEEKALGDYIKYDDHLAIVEKLKIEIADLKVKAEEAYDEGYGVGNSDGYCQGLVGED